MKRPPASLQGRALQWLAQREHSRQEMRDKLLRLCRQQANLARAARAAEAQAKGCPAHPPDDEPGEEPADRALEVEAVLMWLEAGGHLSEARFTESRVHARQARFGHRRIQQELKQHGLVLSADASRALAQTEYDRASELWRRRYGAVAPDAAGQLRQARFMAGRGFSMDVVQRLVRRGLDRSAADTED